MVVGQCIVRNPSQLLEEIAIGVARRRGKVGKVGPSIQPWAKIGADIATVIQDGKEENQGNSERAGYEP
jgi:hypothetical protein